MNILIDFKKKYQSMSEPVKASIWYTICNVLNKGIALLSTPIFTRIMTANQYGQFSIFQSWYNIIIIFTSLNIFLGGYTKGLLLYRDDQDKFTSSLLSLTTILTCVFGIVYLLNINFWTQFFGLQPILMAAMFVELTLMPAIEFWAAKERFDFKYKKYVLVTLLISILSLGGGALAVSLTSYKLEARVFSDVLAKAIFTSVIFIMLFIRGRKFFVKKYWIYAIKFNLPLLPHYLSNYVLNQSDRLMIGRMVGNDKAAFYSVAYTISTMMILVTNAINASLTPYIYKVIDANEQGKMKTSDAITRIRKATSPLFLLVAGLCILTMGFAPEVIYIFAGSNYTEAIYVIPPIAASVYFIFLYSMFSTIEYYYQMTGFIALATTISAGLNLILNFIFIKLYGYYAAGYTTLVCYILLSLMHYICYQIALKKYYIQDCGAQLYSLRLILTSGLFVIIIMFIMAFSYKYFVFRYGIISVLLVIALINRKKITTLLKSFRNS